MEFRILGPVEAYTGARRLDLGPRMHRLLLAILLAEGRLVTTDQLIDRIWDDDPPVSARDLLHGYASKLRARLNAATGAGPDPADGVETGDAAFPDSPVAGQVMPKYSRGYLIHTSRDSVDAHRFCDRFTAAQAMAGQDDAAAAALLRQALRHWPPATGGSPGARPLADLDGRWAQQYRRWLYGRHRLAVTTCLQAELRLGRHAQIIPELEDLAHSDPTDEAVAALLMSAYYRAGRQAEALHTFTHTRARLRDDLGADPGRDLTRLHERILNHDPALYPSPSRTVTVLAVPEDRPTAVRLPDRAPAPAQNHPGADLATRSSSPSPASGMDADPASPVPAEPAPEHDRDADPSDPAEDSARQPRPQGEEARPQAASSEAVVRRYGGDHMEIHSNVFHGAVTFTGKSTTRHRPTSDGDDRT